MFSDYRTAIEREKRRCNSYNLNIIKGSKKKHKIAVDFISYEGMQTLTNYDWPGNVRELENTLERILLIHDKPIIESDDINNILDDSTKMEVAMKSQTLKENILW